MVETMVLEFERSGTVRQYLEVGGFRIRSAAFAEPSFSWNGLDGPDFLRSPIKAAAEQDKNRIANCSGLTDKCMT
jgi:hypothetical protein